MKNNSKKYNKYSDSAKKYGVKKSRNGLCQNFKNTKYLQSKDAIFKIQMTGSRSKDFERCYDILAKKLGLSKLDVKVLKKDYTWHHLDDLNENLECTMQLVSRDAHSVSHIGSAKQYEEATGITYK